LSAATPYKYLFNTDQGTTESIFEDFLSKNGQKIHRFMELIQYEYNRAGSEWPITAYLKNHASGAIEAWLVKYILGADGARSATRKIAGIPHSSQGGDHVWAVADVYIDTDFPDYRRRCAIRTPHGGCMLIPRKDEGLRVFLQMDEHQTQAVNNHKPENFLQENSAFKLTKLVQSHIHKVIYPYKMNITEIVWISQYSVAQRIVHRFQDENKHVFLLGDACHTHSPKAGQGMNVSISDAYNLTWKLALVLKGIAHPSLLDTYEQERSYIAQQLINFDVKFARLFGQKTEMDSPELQDTWAEGHGFTSGCGYQYQENLLVDPAVHTQINQKSSDPLKPGKRLLPIELIRHMDGNQHNLLHDMASNGRFHIFIFAGKMLLSTQLNALAKSLTAATSPLNTLNSQPLGYLPRFRHEDITSGPIPSANKGCFVDLFLIHSLEHSAISVSELPEPFSNTWQSRIYRDVDGLGHQQLGVPEDLGALAVVRPDGYVGLITGFNQLDDVTAYFGNFMLEQKTW
jgi:phenol 2-monooxygenase